MAGWLADPQTERREQLASILQAHDFPRTLLPLTTVMSFSISGQGRIEICLRGAVQGRFGKHVLKYSSNITALLSLGRMTLIDGIQMKELGFWVPARRIYMEMEASREPCVVLHSALMSTAIPATTFALVFPHDYVQGPKRTFHDESKALVAPLPCSV